MRAFCCLQMELFFNPPFSAAIWQNPRSYSKESGGKLQITWNNPKELESYISQLQDAAEKLSTENRKLRKWHSDFTEKVLFCSNFIIVLNTEVIIYKDLDVSSLSALIWFFRWWHWWMWTYSDTSSGGKRVLMVSVLALPLCKLRCLYTRLSLSLSRILCLW